MVPASSRPYQLVSLKARKGRDRYGMPSAPRSRSQERLAFCVLSHLLPVLDGFARLFDGFRERSIDRVCCQSVLVHPLLKTHPTHILHVVNCIAAIRGGRHDISLRASCVAVDCSNEAVCALNKPCSANQIKTSSDTNFVPFVFGQMFVDLRSNVNKRLLTLTKPRIWSYTVTKGQRKVCS